MVCHANMFSATDKRKIRTQEIKKPQVAEENGEGENEGRKK